MKHTEILKLLTGRSDWKMTAPFGEMGYPRTRPHDGEDYGLPTGTLLTFPEDAEVTADHWGVSHGSSTSFGQDFGNWTIFYVAKWDRSYLVAHTAYQASMVDTGKHYKKGDVITKSGNTGLTTGPHLHLGVAIGRHTSLSSIRNAGIAFSEDNPGETVEIITIPAGSTLYNRNGVAYPNGTTRQHTLNVVEKVGNLTGVNMPGADPSLVYVKKQEAPKPKPQTNVGKTAQLRGNVTLYNRNGVAYPVPSGRNRDRTILEEVNGMYKITDTAFDPQEVYVKAGDVKVV